jgi:hypothetical protein
MGRKRVQGVETRHARTLRPKKVRVGARASVGATGLSSEAGPTLAKAPQQWANTFLAAAAVRFDGIERDEF